MIKIDGKEYPDFHLLGFASSTGPESGKSYVTEFLKDSLGQVVQLSFAAPVKKFARALAYEIWGVDLDKMKKSDHINATMTVRDFYVSVGNGLRQVYPAIWVNLFKDGLKLNLEAQSPKVKNWLITVDDVRYVNEFLAIGEMGGTVFNVSDMTGKRPIDAGDLFHGIQLFSGARTLYNGKTQFPDLLLTDIRDKLLPLILKEAP